jgi:hypothetical protein
MYPSSHRTSMRSGARPFALSRREVCPSVRVIPPRCVRSRRPCFCAIPPACLIMAPGLRCRIPIMMSVRGSLGSMWYVSKIHPLYTSAQKERRPECDTVTSPDFITQRPRNRMPRNEITGKRAEITRASEGKRMRYCFDFLSFGVSIRFMVEHEAPHFLCASVRNRKQP